MTYKGARIIGKKYLGRKRVEHLGIKKLKIKCDFPLCNSISSGFVSKKSYCKFHYNEAKQIHKNLLEEKSKIIKKKKEVNK